MRVRLTRFVVALAVFCGGISVRDHAASQRSPAVRGARGPRQPTQLPDVQFYGASPHVPLARVPARALGGEHLPRIISSPPAGACRGWSRVGSIWSALDRWGQPTAQRALVSRDYYDVTHCDEVTFAGEPPSVNAPSFHEPAVLYARGWQPGPSVAWVPSDAEREGYETFLNAFVAQFDDERARRRVAGRESDGASEPPPPTVAESTLFFAFDDVGDPDNEVAARRREMAVTGGRILVIAERVGQGPWRVGHVDSELGTDAWHTPAPYRPLAVFDMNGDGWPEIVVHAIEGGGEFYGDFVLSREPSASWRVVARSVGGSTA